MFKKATVYFALVAMLAAGAWAQTTAIAQSTPPDAAVKKTIKRHVAKPVKRDDTTQKIRDLNALVEQQQNAMQQMHQETQQELQQLRQQLLQTQQQLSSTQQTAQQANANVTAVETNTSIQVQKVQADLSDVKATVNTSALAVQKEEKRVSDLEHPLALNFKGIRITPWGFLELTGFYRSHAELTDQSTVFSAMPLESQINGPYNSHLSEFMMSARDSRMVVRADAAERGMKFTGFYEMDFFGVGTTSNLSQTSSYTPRLRQAWGRVQWSNGWAISGGQMWSLMTLNRKGVDADTPWIPNVMEASYTLGYQWLRTPEIRVSKNFNHGLAFGIELDQPNYSAFGANNTVSTVTGLAAAGAGQLTNSLPSTCTATASSATPPVITVTCVGSPLYSTGLAPDLIAKLAYDNPKLGHFEVKGIGRFFRDRSEPVAATSTAAAIPAWNNTGLGGGIGYGAIIPIVPKKLDFVSEGMYGKGVSRYIENGQYDAVLRSTPDHNLQMIKSVAAFAGFEAHPTPKIELNAFFGEEYYGRTTYLNSEGILAGYGAQTAVNSGCYYETAALATAAGVSSACTGNNRTLWNAKLYGYYTLYKGPKGQVVYGVEADYDQRNTWSGAGGLAPKGNEKTAFSTMRFILP
jgi:hypothetical protein